MRIVIVIVRNKIARFTLSIINIPFDIELLFSICYETVRWLKKSHEVRATVGNVEQGRHYLPPVTS